MCNGCTKSATVAHLVQQLHPRCCLVQIVGVSTNVQFLDDLAGHTEFARGHVHTGFIEQHKGGLFPPRPPLSHPHLCQAVAALLLTERDRFQAAAARGNGEWLGSDGLLGNDKLLGIDELLSCDGLLGNDGLLGSDRLLQR